MIKRIEPSSTADFLKIRRKYSCTENKIYTKILRKLRNFEEIRDEQCQLGILLKRWENRSKMFQSKTGMILMYYCVQG